MQHTGCYQEAARPKLEAPREFESRLPLRSHSLGEPLKVGRPRRPRPEAFDVSVLDLDDARMLEAILARSASVAPRAARSLPNECLGVSRAKKKPKAEDSEATPSALG